MNLEDLKRKYRAFNVTSYHRRIKLKAIQYKGGKCQSCGYSKSPAALTFHHRDPNEKDFGISGQTKNWEKLKPELDKTDLLCHNCHSEEHERIVDGDRQLVLSQIREVIPERLILRKITTKCVGCGKKLRRNEGQENNSFCTTSCSHKNQERIEWPGRDELERLVWSQPLTIISTKLGVSSNAIKKRCKKLDISTPGLGYWGKRKSETGS